MLILLLITLLLYLASALVLWRRLAHRTGPLVWQQLLPFAAVLSHGLLLWQYLGADDFDHLNITSSLSCVAFFLALLSLVRQNKSGGLLLRPVIYLFAAVTSVLLLISPVSWGAQLDNDYGLAIHIVLSLIAYAVLLLATLYAVQLLYLTYLLKQHKINAVASYLPPLMTVERYFFRLVSTGTLMLIAALVSGFVFLDNMFIQGQSHKTILSSIAAIIYLAVVYLHGVRGIRGRSLVIASVVASVILTLAYFGSRFVKDVLLAA
ncbi:inner membrane protein YpjD [Pseudidiomarina sp.]|uniref:cytochrome C assembly family protein n=1 Tax=Pseudidiomarina sp. TaxID=2081707 RepID=UPI00299CE405|nr:cytochrome c biogenesis protein CcsA [Pseudidiomarina sp.]MDX1706111.1 cytochrome c biogenesis protein CcsA [Pseudidiomarina sp.]